MNAKVTRFVSVLDSKIDELYALPLAEFTGARNALAKTLGADDAARVKRLEKPSVVAWSVNQLYWRERLTYERLMASGRALRAAQIAALKGRTNDLRTITADHRVALSAALASATRLAALSGARPAPEPLSRMLEALSLSNEPPAAPGRLTDLIQPAGFEALAGITPVARPDPAPPPTATPVGRSHVTSSGSSKRDAAEERRRADQAAAARKAAEAAHRQARHALEQATTAEARAQARTDLARQQLDRAEADLRAARDAVERARDHVARTEAALSAS